MDSLRTVHARVAALSRRRAPDDPDLAAARKELALCKARTRELRARVSSLPPAACAKLLPKAQGASAGV